MAAIVYGAAATGLLGVAGASLAGFTAASVCSELTEEGRLNPSHERTYKKLAGMSLVGLGCMKASRAYYGQLTKRISKLPPMPLYIAATNRVGLVVATVGAGFSLYVKYGWCE